MLIPRPPRRGRRQRFYARNAVKTTLDVSMAPAFAHLMRSFQAEPAPWHYTTRFHPMQTSFADEIRGTAARLIAYVVAPALLAILAARYGTGCPPQWTEPAPERASFSTIPMIKWFTRFSGVLLAADGMSSAGPTPTAGRARFPDLGPILPGHTLPARRAAPIRCSDGYIAARHWF